MKKISYSVMGDRIECGTFCVAATISKGNLKIKGFDPKLINTELNLLKKVGAKIKIKGSRCRWKHGRRRRRLLVQSRAKK